MILTTLLAEDVSSFLHVLSQRRNPRRHLKESNDLAFREVLPRKSTSMKKGRINTLFEINLTGDEARPQKKQE